MVWWGCGVGVVFDNFESKFEMRSGLLKLPIHVPLSTYLLSVQGTVMQRSTQKALYVVCVSVSVRVRIPIEAEVYHFLHHPVIISEIRSPTTDDIASYTTDTTIDHSTISQQILNASR